MWSNLGWASRSKMTRTMPFFVRRSRANVVSRWKLFYVEKNELIKRQLQHYHMLVVLPDHRWKNKRGRERWYLAFDNPNILSCKSPKSFVDRIIACGLINEMSLIGMSLSTVRNQIASVGWHERNSEKTIDENLRMKVIVIQIMGTNNSHTYRSMNDHRSTFFIDCVHCWCNAASRQKTYTQLIWSRWTVWETNVFHNVLLTMQMIRSVGHFDWMNFRQICGSSQAKKP